MGPGARIEATLDFFLWGHYKGCAPPSTPRRFLLGGSASHLSRRGLRSFFRSRPASPRWSVTASAPWIPQRGTFTFLADLRLFAILGCEVVTDFDVRWQMGPKRKWSEPGGWGTGQEVGSWTVRSKTLVFDYSRAKGRGYRRLGRAGRPGRAAQARIPDKMEYTSNPQTGEVVIYRDLLTAGLRFPLDPVVIGILRVWELYLYTRPPTPVHVGLQDQPRHSLRRRLRLRAPRAQATPDREGVVIEPSKRGRE